MPRSLSYRRFRDTQFPSLKTEWNHKINTKGKKKIGSNKIVLNGKIEMDFKNFYNRFMSSSFTEVSPRLQVFACYEMVVYHIYIF